MSSAFYLFKLPPQWMPFLAFNLVVDGAVIGAQTGTSYALCCSVIPMGWLNSVGIMQEISENLLLHQGLDPRNQIARGRVLPQWLNQVLRQAVGDNRSWWHVYLDNYAGGERLTPEGSGEGACIFHEMAEDAWRTAGVVSSDKKRVSGERIATELGAQLNGDSKTLGVGTEKLVKTIQSTLWMLNQRFLTRKQVQIMAGRWVFILQFRRPAMSFLQQTWKFISGNTPITAKLRREVKGEFLALVSMAPLLHCNLGAEISHHLICTDASEKAGSVELASGLTVTGQDFLTAAEAGERASKGLPTGILVVSCLMESEVLLGAMMYWDWN